MKWIPFLLLFNFCSILSAQEVNEYKILREIIQDTSYFNYLAHLHDHESNNNAIEIAVKELWGFDEVLTIGGFEGCCGLNSDRVKKFEMIINEEYEKNLGPNWQKTTTERIKVEAAIIANIEQHILSDKTLKKKRDYLNSKAIAVSYSYEKKPQSDALIYKIIASGYRYYTNGDYIDYIEILYDFENRSILEIKELNWPKKN